MSNIFPIDFEEKNTIANNDFILFSDSEDGNKLKKAQYSNLKGEQGDPGTPGAAATITVGSTSTGEPGTSASVTNSGTSSAAVLNFTIPKGAKGEPGQDGADGTSATITVGTTTTLSPGSSATVTNVGTSQAAIFNFGIPKGDSGTGSGDVVGPASSTDDNIVTFDGATGKVIQDSGINISALNTQTFTLSSTSDLTTAQAAYNWYLAGNNAIIKYYNKLYFYDHSTDTNAYWVVANEKVLDQSSYSTWAKDAIQLTISSNTVTAITSLQISTSDSGFIRVGKNYGTPYTPTNNGSPATKKYVDDSITGITFPVTSVNGNTGAVTGLQNEHTAITVTLAAASWISKSVTVSVAGVTASNTVIVSPAPSDFSDYTDAVIYCSAQGSGTLTFSCDTEPTNDIDVNVVILN